jgi:hypothetical protein
MASPPPPQKAVSLLWVTILVGVVGGSNSFVGVEGAYWCVARSDASEQALQTALDYACGTGGDCTPIQSNGLCYLPNTIQAHASYAFNSYFQRKAMAPGSCDFSGTATIAQTDPSMFYLFLYFYYYVYLSIYIYFGFCDLGVGYGSCVYPSSLRYVISFSFLGYWLIRNYALYT